MFRKLMPLTIIAMTSLGLTVAPVSASQIARGTATGKIVRGGIQVCFDNDHGDCIVFTPGNSDNNGGNCSKNDRETARYAMSIDIDRTTPLGFAKLKQAINDSDGDLIAEFQDCAGVTYNSHWEGYLCITPSYGGGGRVRWTACGYVSENRDRRT